MQFRLFIVNPSINRIGLRLWPCLTAFLLLNPTLYTKVQDLVGRLVQTPHICLSNFGRKFCRVKTPLCIVLVELNDYEITITIFPKGNEVDITKCFVDDDISLYSCKFFEDISYDNK